jgi:short-subunit dehydrogenase
LPAWPEHSASKYALCGLTEALRGEMVRFDIDVLLVLPGLIKTGELDRHLLRDEAKLKIYETGATPPEEVASAVLRALEHNRTETVVGRDARWLQRVNCLVPRFVDWVCARKVKQLYADTTSAN